MTDDELTAIIAEIVDLPAKSNDAVQATFCLARKLELEPEFVGRPPRYINIGMQSACISTQMVAQRMSYIARTDGKSPKDAVAWLRRIPQHTECMGGAIKALYGVQCKERIYLSDDIVLLPFPEIPKSGLFDWFLSEHDRVNDPPGILGATAYPEAVLYRRGKISPIFASSPPDNIQPYFSWFSDLDVATLLLALTPGACPSEAAHWINFEDPDIDALANVGVIRNLPEF
jgi:hypothetical protein